MRQLRTQGLDHVALAVSDQARFERWYRDVLGLERVYEQEWGDVPITLVSEGSGVALFQAQPGPESGPAVRILHIAFRVDRQNIEAAQRTLDDRGIPYHCEDYGVSHSVYFRDPDGHELESTTTSSDPAEAPSPLNLGSTPPANSGSSPCAPRSALATFPDAVADTISKQWSRTAFAAPLVRKPASNREHSTTSAAVT